MISARKKGAALSYILMIVEILSSLFFAPFLIRTLGQSEYGVYSLVNSITVYLSLFDLGVGNSIIRYMAKYRVQNDKKKQENLLTVTLIFYFIIGLLVLFVGLVLRNGFGRIFGEGLSGEQISQATAMLTITMLNVIATLIFAPYNKTLLAFECFGFSKISDIIKIILRTVVSAVVLIMGGRGLAVVTVNLIMTILFGSASVMYVTAVLRLYPSMAKPDAAFLKEIFAYSFIIFVQLLAMQINQMVDQVIMGMVVTASAAIIGVYAVGAQISGYLNSIASSINSVLMPGVVKIVETTEDSRIYEQEMVRIGRLVFMLIGIIYTVFVVAGKEFICLWAGAENEKAYYVACIIMLSQILGAAQSIGAQFLWALDKHKMLAVIQMCVAAANIVLTLIMVKWNPLLGASIATAITYCMGTLVTNLIFRKAMEISLRRYYKGLFKGIVPSLIPAVVVGAAVGFIDIGMIGGFILKCTSMTAVYVVCMYIKGMNESERNIVKSVILKITGGKINVQG